MPISSDRGIYAKDIIALSCVFQAWQIEPMLLESDPGSLHFEAYGGFILGFILDLNKGSFSVRLHVLAQYQLVWPGLIRAKKIKFENLVIECAYCGSHLSVFVANACMDSPSSTSFSWP